MKKMCTLCILRYKTGSATVIAWSSRNHCERRRATILFKVVAAPNLGGTVVQVEPCQAAAWKSLPPPTFLPRSTSAVPVPVPLNTSVPAASQLTWTNHSAGPILSNQSESRVRSSSANERGWFTEAGWTNAEGPRCSSDVSQSLASG